MAQFCSFIYQRLWASIYVRPNWMPLHSDAGWHRRASLLTVAVSSEVSARCALMLNHVRSLEFITRFMRAFGSTSSSRVESVSLRPYLFSGYRQATRELVYPSSFLWSAAVVTNAINLFLPVFIFRQLRLRLWDALFYPPEWDREHGSEMQTFLKGRRVGYWLSEKKLKKLNFQAFADMCRYVAGTTSVFIPSGHNW